MALARSLVQRSLLAACLDSRGGAVWASVAPPRGPPRHALCRGGGGGGGGSARGMSISSDEIPFVDKKLLQVKYARSSGPGGQHVNKTESKVDMRVRVDQLDLPKEVRERLMELYGSKINKDNELVVTAEASRTRQRNYSDCLEKLAEIMTDASTFPAERNMNSKTKGRFNENRLLEKKAKSTKKSDRRSKIDY